MVSRYITEVFSGLDQRTVAVTLTSLFLAGGVMWAVLQLVTYVRNLIKRLRIVEADVNRALRALSAINAEKLHVRLHSPHHKSVRVPPLVPPHFPEPPPLPTIGADNWDDDDGRPSADTHVKSP